MERRYEDLAPEERRAMQDGTPETRAEHTRLFNDWMARGRPVDGVPQDCPLGGEDGRPINVFPTPKGK